METCFLEFCNTPKRKAGLCHTHYERRRRGGASWDQPSVYEMTDSQRFFLHVDKQGGYPDFADPLMLLVEADGECWTWTAGIIQGDGDGGRGYGRFKLWNKEWKAHRYSYILHGGDGTVEAVDHLCRRRACVNPAHLEGVTAKVNADRGAGCTGVNARKTHCPQGHLLGGDNEYKGRGSRSCKTCNSERNARIDAERAQCKNGHEYPNPTRRGPSGRRICDVCQDLRWTGRALKRKENTDA